MVASPDDPAPSKWLTTGGQGPRIQASQMYDRGILFLPKLSSKNHYHAEEPLHLHKKHGSEPNFFLGHAKALNHTYNLWFRSHSPSANAINSTAPEQCLEMKIAIKKPIYLYFPIELPDLWPPW